MSMQMEPSNTLDWPTPLALLLLALPVLFFLYFTCRKTSERCPWRPPPSPPGLPLIGNLHQLGPLPHRSMHQLARDHGPVMLLRLGRVPAVVVSTPELAREVMRTRDADCCSRPGSPGPSRLSYGLKDVAFAPYGDYWREMRKLFVVEMLRAKRVQSIWDAREAHDTFLGGVDTSSVTLLWAMSELIRSPRVLAKAQDELRRVLGRMRRVDPDDLASLSYLKMVVKEALRLHPPATLLLPRETVRATTIGGYDVATGTRVFVNVWAIGRDPDSWESPDEFLPERFEGSDVDFAGQHFELVPFGAGRRACPAIAMGAANVEFCLANLLYCFDWTLPEGMKCEDVSMEEEGGLSFHRKVPLWLVPLRYKWHD
ncbi:hypothetical protein ABZP36_000510 [Zizania latifolia]